MKRHILRKGDKSTNGGIVTQGIENCTDHGVPMTYIGAEIWCNGCGSVGHIGPQGPRHHAVMYGKQQALDGDICLCRCVPPPLIRASQSHSSHSFDAHELPAMRYDTHGQARLAEPTGDFDERVRVVDANRLPISGAPYHIRTASGAIYKGLTDSLGYCPRIYTDSAARLDVAIGIRALERWETAL
ncbi:PAAR domain-containing protein [Paraburkholderia sp. ZP32-5]|uniref:PAAR domain-containing protein n=1 Tax=Paraburkholderia sp. ZP32-5 TaxID=2883245 RepID=UPI001F310250|nr:PAAR domain-containing protein [Paraburkholderia sp. ZP32-5]